MINSKEYDGYEKAMIKNGKTPISFERLVSHFSSQECEIFREKSAWIGGNIYDDAFFPSHAGYHSLKDIRKLLIDLGNSQLRICFAVTENIAKQMARLNWVFDGKIVVDYPYRQEKCIMINESELIFRKRSTLIQEMEFEENSIPFWQYLWDGKQY